MNPIYQKELDVFREEFKKMETFENRFHCDNCRMLVSATLESVFLEALKRASMAVVEASVGEDKKLPRKFDCPDCVSLMKELDRDDVVCAICNGERGYNQSIADTLATAREITGVNNK